MYDYALESGSYETSNLDANIWDLALFDVVPFTDIVVNESIESVQTPTFIEGKASGAVGFLRYDVSNSGIITAYNVRGNFIKGEELVFDGNDSDRITIASTTYGISNVKSIFGQSGSGTFSADVRQSPEIALGPCKIDGSGVVTQAGRDFTKDFIVNDLVSYRTPGGARPTVNRVSAVTVDDITLAAVENVTGVSLGAVASNTDSIDIFKISTKIANTNTGDDNYLFTRLPKKVVSTVDTSNSELSFRKRFDTTVTPDATGGRITILPSQLGSTETFLPFDEERYIVINTNGQTEALTQDKFTITSGNKELIIRGLSVTGSAVLIATLKTNDVEPITKLRNRLEAITVSKSKLPGSGIGATTLNDGLEYGNYPYGTRVQDKDICLLQPDVMKLHGVFESSTEGEAEIPNLILRDIDSFNGSAEDILIGEEIIGSESGCVAIISDVIDSANVEFIVINDKEFIFDEKINCQETEITATIDAITPGDNNITNQFTLVRGTNNTIYDYSRIVRDSSSAEPIKSLRIFYEYASLDSNESGCYMSVDSYFQFDYKDIGNTNGIRHSDIIDIRPRVDQYIVEENKRSPFEFLGRDFFNDQNDNLKILASDESLTFDYQIYLPRIDKIYLNKDKIFQLSRGVSAENPEEPSLIEDAIEVARIVLPAYLFNTSDAKLSLSTYKRYQMRDIAGLEDRIKNLEYYTSLSLLEQSTANLEIKDSAGTDRFKSGFFVDNFTTTTNQIKLGAKNSIDPRTKELRPAAYTTQLDLLLGSTELTGVGGEKNLNADPRYVTDLIGEDIRRSTVDPNGNAGSDGMGIITLDYEEIELISQDTATRVVNAAPYFVTFYKGTITLNPSSDIWVEQSRVETQTVEGLIGGYSVTNIEAKPSDLDPQAGWSPILWGGWNEEWTGKKVTNNSVRDKASSIDDGVKVTASTTIVSQTTTNTGTATQQGLSTQIETVPGNNINLGDKIIASNVSSFLRSRNIEVLARRLKPLTRMYAFFSGINVTNYCIPKLIEIEMIGGTFRVGETVESTTRTPGIIEDKPYIKFRVAQPRHRNGAYNDPIDGYGTSPYNGADLPEDYSVSSKLLNVDLTSLCLQAQGDFYGYISPGMTLVGKSSGARARISNVRLVSDNTGSLFASFYIPNSNSKTAPRFKSGNNTLKIQDNANLNAISGTLNSATEGTYFSQGTIEQVQGSIISTRNVEVTNAYTTQSQAIFDEQTTITGVDVDLTVSVTPQPIPRPIPQPKPQPKPQPTPKPQPQPRPRPTPKPKPQPKALPPVPNPKPEPRPQPLAPQPKPAIPPKVQPKPRPQPKASKPPKPRPKPKATFKPPKSRQKDDSNPRPLPPKAKPVKPVPNPKPKAVANPPKPKPKPHATPKPQPKPNPNPKPNPPPPVVAPKKPPTNPKPKPKKPKPIPIPKPKPKNPKPKPKKPKPIPIPKPRPVGDRPGDEPTPRPPAFVEPPEDYDDPLAQSFFVGGENYKTGVFVTSASLYFKTTSDAESCFVQLRPMVNGLPSHKAYPMSNVVLQGADVVISEDASVPTIVTFPSPIYLEGNKEHCIVVGSRSTAFNLWVSRLGEVDVSNLDLPESEQVPITKQANLGSLFKSQNSYTWTPSQYEDLKYSLNRAEFTDRGSISFFNPDLSRGNGQIAILKKDALVSSSRQIVVGLGTTANGFGTEIVPGNTVIQDDTTGTGNFVMGLGIATGNLTVVNAGLGLTPSSGFFDYPDVTLTRVTGRGENAVADIHVNNGVAVAATITFGGNGFKVGDIVTGIVGEGVGRNLQLSIAEIHGINELVIDQVQGDFVVGTGKTLRYINSSGVTSEFSANSTVTLDTTPRIINDGLHIKVNHLNHGMHSGTNRVNIVDVASDIPSSGLGIDINETQTVDLEVGDASRYSTFEGIGIGTTNPGYIKIDSEIIGYTTITGNVIGGLTRGVDNTSATGHESGSLVMKYESCGVSLRRINKIHDLQDATVNEALGLDHYNIRLDMSAETGEDRTASSTFPELFLNETKSFGGVGIQASQNISYEIMKPIISTMTLQKTNISARARTVSSSSISGNEVAFIDQGYEQISLDKDNYFETPRLVASNVNADNLLTNVPGQKSFEIELTLDSYDSRLSPIVDLDRVGAIFVSNRVNEVISDYSSDRRTASIKDDPNAFIYATKPIELEIPANNIRVLAAAYINNFSDIRAFYAITNNPDEELIYYPFPGFSNLLESGQVIDSNKNDGTSDSFVSPVDNKGFESVSLAFKDYEFTIENLPSFKFFSVKMVATSRTQCYPPRIRDFRAVAFA